ncbi:hypothetical protein BH11PLA2_BH11PLA2_00590 [soil metagenome]
MAVLIAAVYAGMFAIANRIQKNAVISIDAVDVAEIDRMELLVIRRPDSGPDIRAEKTDPITVPAAEYKTILTPLLKANPVKTDRGVWMGKLILYLKDGRKLEVLLYSVNEQAKGPMRYKIEEYQYEVESVTPFLAAVDAVDGKMKGRK